jgi:hypothetical protein
MKKLKLIVENGFESHNISDIILEESKDGLKKKLAKFKALGIETDVKNRNGRYYPYQMMVPVVEKYVSDRMQRGSVRSYGELGHPEGVEINLNRISHYLESLVWEGKNCFCQAQLLDTEFGRIADTILKEGLQLGVSTRGLGALDEDVNPAKVNGADVVGEFNLVAIDIVADPSAPRGWIKGICENRQYIIDDGNYQPLIEGYDNLDNALASLPKKDVDTYLAEKLTKFFKDIRK